MTLGGRLVREVLRLVKEDVDAGVRRHDDGGLDGQGAFLHAFHGEAGGDVAEGDGGDEFAVEGVVGGDVGDDDVEEVVDVAGHAPGADDLRRGGDGLGETFEPGGGVVGGFNRDEDGDGEA